MLRPVTKITITTATKTLFFDFVNHWEFSNNWEDLSAQGKIVFPKNIYVRDTATNKRYPLFGKNKATGEMFKKGTIHYDQSLINSINVSSSTASGLFPEEDWHCVK